MTETIDVVVVDDEAVILRTLQMLLQKKNFSVHTFPDVNSARQYFITERQPCTVALIDYSMPGTNGVVLAEEIQRYRPDVAPIIMSGYFSGEPGTPYEGTEIPAIGKPSEIEVIVRVIEEQRARRQ